jgi:hypothetical protein
MAFAYNKFLKSLVILIAFTILSPTFSHAIDSKNEWDAAFLKQYGSQDPLLYNPGTSPGNLFAWTGHYWLRAYVTMADAYNDSYYLDKAVSLIDHMFYYRDDSQVARGEWNIKTNPYLTAPLYYLNNRDKAAPGWCRIWDNNRRIEVVTDGQIVNAIMRFVDLVYNNPKFISYKSKALEYAEKVKETISIHDTQFVYNRFSDIPGSYYWPNVNGSGLYSNPVPFNQSATMGVALLLLDKLEGGGTEYREKAFAIANYWKNKAVIVNDTYVWNYHLQKSSIEDISHGDIDISFFYMAFKAGLLTNAEMQLLSNTFTKNLYRGNDAFAGFVDGSDTTNSSYWIGVSWKVLHKFDSNVLTIVKNIYSKYYDSPSFAHTFLGWAEILKSNLSFNAILNPPTNLCVVTSQKY